MYKLIISILTLMTFFSFEQQSEKEEFICQDFKFRSYQEQADSLVAFMNRAQKSSSNVKQDLEKKFFCAFPNSFEEMKEVFGYDDVKGEAPLYNYPIGENMIGFFSKLESIPDSIYFDKYIRININGTWEADNIREAFGFGSKLYFESEKACKFLSYFSDKEIESVFKFIFDGPHPKNEYNEGLYEEIKPKIERQNTKLGQLFTKVYMKLMEEDDGHGH